MRPLFTLLLAAACSASPAIVRDASQLQGPDVQLKTDPREDLTVPQLLGYYGYGSQVHHVVTQDGYILELHRVISKNGPNCALPANQNNQSTAAGQCQPLLLQHGLLSSSATWVMNTPDKALAYMAADEGFDVWMGNARGNIYSINHTSLDTSSYEFWDFCYDEMGKYDLPAVIDYILSVNNYDKIHYAGHSMGTMMFWILENTVPGYAESKVKSMSAMGPVAYVAKGTSPMTYIAPFNKYLDEVVRGLFHEYRMFKPDSWIVKLTEEACAAGNITDAVCSNTLFLLVGFDADDLDLSWFPVIDHQLLAGASTRTLVHFGQGMADDTFSMFDYRSKNMEHYHQATPPKYDLSKVHVPVLLKWGWNDILADPKDVARMVAEMTGTTVVNSPVSNPKFAHLDFVYGKDAHIIVYPEVLDFMKKYL